MTQDSEPENQDEIDEDFDAREFARKFIEENRELFDKLARE